MDLCATTQEIKPPLAIKIGLCFAFDSLYWPCSGMDDFCSAPLLRPLKLRDEVEISQPLGLGHLEAERKPAKYSSRVTGTVISIIRGGEQVEAMEDFDFSSYTVRVQLANNSGVLEGSRSAHGFVYGDIRLPLNPGHRWNHY